MTMINFPETIDAITQELQSEVVIKRTLTDAINGYGRSELWEVQISILDSVCQLCGARALLTSIVSQCFPPDKHKHKWRNEFVNSIYGAGKTADEAMAMAELDAKSFMELRE